MLGMASSSSNQGIAVVVGVGSRGIKAEEEPRTRNRNELRRVAREEGRVPGGRRLGESFISGGGVWGLVDL
ncbi:hypothetical protein TIFTF001_047328 [Ficus carica]|uniref:Uncharacterized protein n=1 Tax=Ficus carica TaxID=3494 RepID=A0AA87Z9G5_FICCA|nr:hypothetical protein TIFTF001_047328 [Ficus carica]